MISHKHKFIFVHVQKTAGTSVRFALQGEQDEILNPYHLGISEVKEKLPEQVFQSYFKFGAVRNPWDREVSRYIFFKKLKATRTKFCQNGFNEYLFKFMKLGRLNYDALKIDGKIGVDYIIKFENLQEDFNIVCDKIGISRRKFPYSNNTNHKHYTEYYDDETRQMIAQKYADDIKYFGYKFGD